MKYILTADNLNKNYRHSHALHNFSMHIPKGAIYGFVGENGAGKTTLIRTICGLQAPTSGTYSLYGVKNTDKRIREAQQRIGVVVESPAVYLDMSAENNLKHQYHVLGLPTYDGLKELLHLVGLEKTGRKKVRNYSLGMKQRLGIAVALAGNPDFLILDEPTNGLDPQGIIELRELILKLNRQRQITVLISSHNLDELSRTATHYGFIVDGSMVKEITAEELAKACRKCAVLTVTDTGVLARALDLLGLEYDILSESTANVYGEIPISELTLELAKDQCRILSLHEKDETLESYYINLTGGGRYE
ncbi:ABC transporter ATP-binding protein [Mediterraneibacter glycyrrhizinilyticus]|nr:ABC transporter ATP-binding protein [Mediterraneibacter glycyrrhizinilyticus]MBM6803691.1 ABC transporter ATP-binding protein [Mediterraneibacter glycyrrhizinilyticus]